MTTPDGDPTLTHDKHTCCEGTAGVLDSKATTPTGLDVPPPPEPSRIP